MKKSELKVGDTIEIFRVNHTNIYGYDESIKTMIGKFFAGKWVPGLHGIGADIDSPSGVRLFFGTEDARFESKGSITWVGRMVITKLK